MAGCKHLQRKNKFLVHDLINFEEKRIFTRNELNTKYNLNIDFMTFAHIEKGLKIEPNFEKTLSELSNSFNIKSHSCYINTLLQDEKCSCRIYNIMLPKVNFTKVEERWGKDSITNVDWTKVNRTIQKSLDCTRLKWLQIRILHRILTTNKSV